MKTLIAAAILVIIGVTFYFLGYHPAVGHGSSMEPTLRDGDIIWLKASNVTDIEIGNIVSLSSLGQEPVIHRVMKIHPLSEERYFLVTQGDANQFTEEWEVSADAIIVVLVARIPVVGHVLQFSYTTLGKTLIGVLLVTLVALWLYNNSLVVSVVSFDI